MKKWLLIDAYNLVFRSFFAIPHLSRSDGFPTNAIHGWIRSIWKLQDTEKADRMLAIFDLGEDPEKYELLPEYKAQRAEMPDELRQQIPVIKDMTRKMGLDLMEVNDVEADDLIGSFATSLADEGDQVDIVSSDKDLAQCVNDRVSLLLPPATANPKSGWRRLDVAGVKEKFGVEPSQIPDYLALIGDTSDNIPGIPGVGPKTAAKWLEKFGSIERILHHCDELTPQRFCTVVRGSREVLDRNLRLTKLNCEVPLPPYRTHDLEPGALYQLLEELEMKRHLEEARKRYSQPDLFS